MGFFDVKKLINNSFELVLYGSIGDSYWWDDVTPEKLNEELDQLGDITELKIRINSYGGSVSAGQAIYSALKRCKFKKIVYIDGIAASIASVIAMAGDEVYMPNNALIMIHNPSTYAYGESKDFIKEADTLEKHKQTIVNVYTAKTKLDEKRISKLMDEETWLTAAEALELGFIDFIEGEEISIGHKTEDILTVNNQAFNVTPQQFKCIQNKLGISPKKDIQTAPKNKEKGDEILTLDELKDKHKDLYEQILNEGRNEAINLERQRIKAIDELAVYGNNEQTRQILDKAKFETGKTAEQVALDVLKHQNVIREGIIQARHEDAKELQDVNQQAPSNNKDEEEEEAFVNLVTNVIKNKRGVK